MKWQWFHIWLQKGPLEHHKTWFHYSSLQEIMVFFLLEFWSNPTPMIFLPPCPTSPKCHFGQVDLDPTVLIRSFGWFFYYTTIIII
jgi:hypothetical protein